MKPITNEFCWSHSQDKEFSGCKRSYYYSRYGSWQGWPNGTGDSKAKELYILKKLMPKKMWLGNAVHGTIREILRQLRAGAPMTEPGARDFLSSRMRTEFKNSESKLYRTNPKWVLGLFEHEYDIPITEEDLNSLVSRGETCLKSFFSSKTYRELKSLKPDSWLTIDERQPSCFLFEGTKVYVKLDLAYRNAKNRITIIDWKTGKSKDVEYKTQLGCYRLYATLHWRIPPSNIDTYEINLALNREFHHTTIPADIAWIESYISKSITAMKSLLRDPANNVAAEEDYPHTENLTQCQRCRYRKVCRPEL
jgi:CRISPR/Cas system-associated exonuclease Cas4 (RecB family)